MSFYDYYTSSWINYFYRTENNALLWTFLRLGRTRKWPERCAAS